MASHGSAILRKIIFVHGAGASPRSFSWLRLHLPAHDAEFITYSVDDSPEMMAERLGARIREQEKPVCLLGHSLGGLIALASARAAPRNVARIVTIATPFKGSVAADFFRWFSASPLFDAIRPDGSLVRGIHAWPLPCPVLSIVATSGLPFIPAANDGAVTVASQMALNGPDYEQYPVNHFEALLDPDIAARVSDFLEKSEV